MVVGFTVFIITKVVSLDPAHGEMCSLQHYVKTKFVSDLRQIGGFLRVFQFPPPIKLTATKQHNHVINKDI
jgi:hypothetical protein